MEKSTDSRSLKEIASLLGTNPQFLIPFKKAVEKVAEQNKKEVSKVLVQLGRPHFAEQVRSLLKNRLMASEKILLNKFGPGHRYLTLVNAMNNSIMTSGVGNVFVLKLSKAMDMMRQDLPHELMKVLGYKNVDEMLAREDVLELYCALRFVQSDEWMHDFFDKHYSKIEKSDFESRPIRFVLMDKRWLKFAGDFVKKKRHPTSHLKELGIVFALPTGLEKSGEFIKAYSVLMQFVYEVGFYTSLFKMYSGSKDFPKKFISLLKGELPQKAKLGNIMVVQRYLFKENPKDWRIRAPHVNPEALHWKRAEEFLTGLDKSLHIWKDHYWAGSILKSFKRNGKLVSLDLADNAVSIHMQDLFSYHYIEGLWYKILEEHYGEKRLIKLMMDNIFTQYIKNEA